MTPMPKARLSFKPEGSNEYQDVGTVKTLHITNGPAHTMSGHHTAFVIVDDPIGCVVRADDVMINRGISFGKSRIMNTVIDEMRPRAPAMGKSSIPILAKPDAKTKKMSGIKGLR